MNDLPLFHEPMVHTVCGTPVTFRRADLGRGLEEMVPWCPRCQRDAPVEELA